MARPVILVFDMRDTSQRRPFARSTTYAIVKMLSPPSPDQGMSIHHFVLSSAALHDSLTLNTEWLSLPLAISQFAATVNRFQHCGLLLRDLNFHLQGVGMLSWRFALPTDTQSQVMRQSATIIHGIFSHIRGITSSGVRHFIHSLQHNARVTP